MTFSGIDKDEKDVGDLNLKLCGEICVPLCQRKIRTPAELFFRIIHK